MDEGQSRHMSSHYYYYRDERGGFLALRCDDDDA